MYSVKDAIYLKIKMNVMRYQSIEKAYNFVDLHYIYFSFKRCPLNNENTSIQPLLRLVLACKRHIVNDVNGFNLGFLSSF